MGLPSTINTQMGNLWKELEAENKRMTLESRELERENAHLKELQSQAICQRANDLTKIQVRRRSTFAHSA
jgi:hypothetical protein